MDIHKLVPNESQNCQINDEYHGQDKPKFQTVSTLGTTQPNISISRQTQSPFVPTVNPNIIVNPVIALVNPTSNSQNASLPQYHIAPNQPAQGSSKYSQLLSVLDELGKDIRPTYTGNRNCQERLKRGIIHARMLVRDCILDVEKSARQQHP